MGSPSWRSSRRALPPAVCGEHGSIDFQGLMEGGAAGGTRGATEPRRLVRGQVGPRRATGPRLAALTVPSPRRDPASLPAAAVQHGGRVPAMPPEAPGQPPVETRRAPRDSPLGFPHRGPGSSSCRAGDTVSGMTPRDHCRLSTTHSVSVEIHRPSLCSRAYHLLHAYARGDVRGSTEGMSSGASPAPRPARASSARHGRARRSGVLSRE
jgi:hypothetical protein